MKDEHLKKVQRAQALLSEVQSHLLKELQDTRKTSTAIEYGGLSAALKALETVAE
jgi:hypothetical protein